MESVIVYENDAPRQSRISACCRFLFLILGAGAITLSLFSIYSCQFFSYRALDGEPFEGLSPPFDELSKASVGLFQYSKTSDSSGIFGEECIKYEDWKEVGQQRYFYVAQWCSIVAPVVAFLALIQILFECCLCRVRGSYMLIRFFFFSAGLVQMCSFFIFAETQFCLDALSQNQCRLQKGGIYSLSATVAYMLIAIAFFAMSPYKDARLCGLCCISTRGGGAMRYHPEEHGDDESHDEKGQGDTSLEDEDAKYDEETAPDAPGESFTGEDYDHDLSQTMSDGPEAAGGSGDGSADRYSQEEVVDVLMANDSDLVSNPDEAALSRVGSNAESLPADPDYDQQQQEEEEEAAPPQTSEAAEVVELPEATEHSRHPDFLDMCCGDPLELEKYMGLASSKTNAAAGETPSTKEEKFARNRSASLRSSLRKISVLHQS